MSKPAAIRKATMDALARVLSPESMKVFAEVAAGMVRLRTRLGDGVAKEGAEKQKLKPLAESTIKARQGKLGFFRSPRGNTVAYKRDGKNPPKLHEKTSPKKSNLTFTGQLLDSIKPKDVRRAHATIGPEGARKSTPPWPGASAPKSALTNEQVAQHVTDGGRPFNHLSRVETKRLADAIKKEVRQEIKKRLTQIK